MLKHTDNMYVRENIYVKILLHWKWKYPAKLLRMWTWLGAKLKALDIKLSPFDTYTDCSVNDKIRLDLTV